MTTTGAKVAGASKRELGVVSISLETGFENSGFGDTGYSPDFDQS